MRDKSPRSAGRSLPTGRWTTSSWFRRRCCGRPARFPRDEPLAMLNTFLGPRPALRSPVGGVGRRASSTRPPSPSRSSPGRCIIGAILDSSAVGRDPTPLYGEVEMAKQGFRVMDSDLHVIEPHDLWMNY